MTDQTRDTSPEVIEAVAKAFWEDQRRVAFGSERFHQLPQWEDVAEWQRSEYRDHATAAITAYESATAPQWSDEVPTEAVAPVDAKVWAEGGKLWVVYEGKWLSIQTPEEIV